MLQRNNEVFKNQIVRLHIRFARGEVIFLEMFFRDAEHFLSLSLSLAYSFSMRHTQSMIAQRSSLKRNGTPVSQKNCSKTVTLREYNLEETWSEIMRSILKRKVCFALVYLFENVMQCAQIACEYYDFFNVLIYRLSIRIVRIYSMMNLLPF